MLRGEGKVFNCWFVRPLYEESVGNLALFGDIQRGWEKQNIDWIYTWMSYLHPSVNLLIVLGKKNRETVHVGGDDRKEGL